MKSRKFKIFLNPVAGRDLKRLKKSQPDIFLKVDKAIESLSQSPFRGKQLKGKLKKCFSLRIGNYRVIYTVYPSQQSLNIARVGDRKEIYRF